ncbi:MAG: hypothetical protein II885_12860, partial [Oscillospiraceae bacterium]|nr:hypothetical protein [Oscillospiraceae bacterium]
QKFFFLCPYLCQLIVERGQRYLFIHTVILPCFGRFRTTHFLCGVALRVLPVRRRLKTQLIRALSAWIETSPVYRCQWFFHKYVFIKCWGSETARLSCTQHLL